MKKLIVIVIIIILLFLKACVRHIDRNHYNISSSGSESNVPNIEEIYISDESTCFESNNFPENLILKKINLYFNGKIIGTMNINKNIHEMKFTNSTLKEYEMEEELLRILGKNNEKYEIATGYMQKGFVFEILIKNTDTEEIYKAIRETSISFDKKGFYFWVPNI